jgi:hypothetical protein
MGVMKEMERRRHSGKTHENQNHFTCSELRAHGGLFIGGDQGSYYNILTVLNQLPYLLST